MYYGTVHLNRSDDETWLMPVGLLLDLWECHRQFLGVAKPKRTLFIEDVIPEGI
jgi:hypothetical protein